MKAKSFVWLFLYASSFAACAFDELENEVPEEEVSSEEERILETAILAEIDLGHGSLVFEIVTSGPFAGELSMSETSTPDKAGAVRLPEQTRSLLERYLIATPEGAPIPAAIVENETREDLLERTIGRPIVERVEGAIVGIASTGPVLSGATGSQMCAEGTTSPSFAAQVCSTNITASLSFCHNGTWHSVTDDTHGFRARNTRSLTLACYANGRVKHRRKGIGWWTTKDRTIPPSAIHQHTDDGNFSGRRRDIRHWRTSSGFVRGASFFW